MTASTAQLSVVADLRMEVGSTAATLTGSGQHLVLRSAEPLALWTELNSAALPASVGRISGPRAIGRIADQLRRSGLDLSIEGPGGILVLLGKGAHSWWGRAVTGSSAVQIRSVRSLLPFAGPLLRQQVSPARSASALAALTAGLVARRWLRRR